MLAKYWWGQTRNEKKIHWIKWEKLCKSKEKGGMGFRVIHALNLVMLAKQEWRLNQDTQTLFFQSIQGTVLP